MKSLKNSLLIAGFLLLIGGIWLITHAYPLQAVAVPISHPEAAGLLAATNTEREALKLPALRLDEALNHSAALKCADMAQHNYYEHDSPTGQHFDTVIRHEVPDAATVAENLAQGYDSSNAVVAAWIKSPAHLANLSDPRLHTVGFAICDTPTYKNMVVQHFSSDL